MNRPAPLRSPIALLTCCALLLGALAALLALSPPARAAVEPVGKFSFEPGTGKITDNPLANKVTTTAPCPAPADPAKPYTMVQLYFTSHYLNSKQILVGNMTAGAPFTQAPVSETVPAGKSVDTLARLGAAAGAAIDGDYELRLVCKNTTASADVYFTTTIHVAGDTWTAVEAKPTAVALTATPGSAAPGSQIVIDASVTPADAAGKVALTVTAPGGEKTELGPVEVAAGKAAFTVTAPATAGQMLYAAVFTPTDPNAFITSTASGFVSVKTPSSPSPSPSGSTTP
ncbi:hypothetical protein, partial [Streptomyces beijiangensis]